MDLLREYDFDCLPLIDREFDDPTIQATVHAMIANEMRSFQPGNYLAYLPLPELTFSKSTALQAEMARLESAPSSSSAKLEMDRYMADRPQKQDEKSEQAWQAAVQNLQSQLAHQENRLLNTEIAAEQHLANTYLKHNNTLEQISNNYTTQIEHLNRDIRNVNKGRQSMQTKAYPELNKLQHKIAMSMDRTWKCQLAYTSIREELKLAGVDAEAVLAQRREQAAMQVDPNDAAHNTTVRQYEQVNTSTGGNDKEEDGENVTKKHRTQ